MDNDNTTRNIIDDIKKRSDAVRKLNESIVASVKNEVMIEQKEVDAIKDTENEIKKRIETSELEVSLKRELLKLLNDECEAVKIINEQEAKSQSDKGKATKDREYLDYSKKLAKYNTTFLKNSSDNALNNLPGAGVEANNTKVSNLLNAGLKTNEFLNEMRENAVAAEKSINDLTAEMDKFRVVLGEVDKDGNPVNGGKLFSGLQGFMDLMSVFENGYDELENATKLGNTENGILAARAKVTKNLEAYMNKYGKSLKRNGIIYKEFVDLQNKLDMGKIAPKEATREFDLLRIRAITAGVEVENLYTKLVKTFSGRMRSMIANQGWFMMIGSLRSVYNNVVEVDTAMTELRKVSSASASELNKFLSGASDKAKQLGSTLVEVVNATADYSRLGYSLQDATGLADAAIIYSNVGDDVDSIDAATTALISTMQGFGIEAKDVMSIVDSFNEVANNYASSAGDIGEITQRSAAAMRAAGSSLDETIALGVTANTVAQDADTVGTAMKTMAMRLRSSKSDLEAAGEDTDGMADSVSKLRDELKALTGVDIMINDDTFKTPYAMLTELGAVWDKLSDVNQANVTELLFGKRQANIGSAILQNYTLAQDILETSQNSAGSALKENEVYLDSIQGRLDKLQASSQSLSIHILDDDSVKLAISSLDKIVTLIDKLLSLGGMIPAAFGVAGVSIAKAFDVKSLGDFKGLFKSMGEGADATKVLNLRDKTDAGTYDAIKKYNEYIALGKKNTKDFGRVQEELKKTLGNTAELENKTAIGYKTIGTSAIVGSNGVKVMATSIKLVAKEMLIASAQMAAITAVMAGIGWLAGQAKEWYDGISQTPKAIKKRFDEANDAITEANNEIESMNSTLEETKKRIEEIKSKGSISLVEQAELEKLQRQNEELERQISLKEEIARVESEKATKEAWAGLQNINNPYLTSINETGGKNIGVLTNPDNNNSSIDAVSALSSLSMAIISEQEKLQQLQKQGLDENDDAYKLHFDNVNKYKEEYNGLLQSTSDYILMIGENYEYVDDEQKKFYNDYNDIVDIMKFKNGDLPIDDLLQNISSVENVKDVIDDLLSDSSKKINQSFLNKIVSKEGIELLKSYGISMKDIINSLSKARKEASEAKKDIPGVWDSIDEMDKIASDFDDLKAVFQDLQDEGGVTQKTFKALHDSNLSTTTGFKDYLSVLANVDSSTDDIKTATNKLLTTYLNQESTIGNLNEKTKGYYIEQLKVLGVTNAQEVVESRLKNSIKDVVAAISSKNNMTQQEINATIDAATQNANLADVEDILKQTGYAAGSAQDFLRQAIIGLRSDGDLFTFASNNEQALLKMAAAAGFAGGALTQYAKLATKLNDAKTYSQAVSLGTQLDAIKTEAQKQLQEVLSSYIYTPVTYSPTLDPPKNTGGDKTNTKTGKTKAEKRKEEYDKAKKDLDHQLKMNEISYREYYKKLAKLDDKYLRNENGKALKGNKDDIKEHNENLAQAREDAFDYYADKEKKKLEAGKISYKTYYNHILSLEKEWLKGHKSNAKKQAEVDSELAKIREEAFDHYAEKEKEKLDNGTISAKTFYNKIKNLEKEWLKGHKANSKKLKEADKQLADDMLAYFEKTIDKGQDKIDYRDLTQTWKPGQSAVDVWKEVRQSIVQAYKDGIITMKQFRELDLKLMEKEHNAQKELNNERKEALEQQKEALDSIIEMVSDMLKQEAEDMIDALQKQDEMYQKIIDRKKESLQLSKDEYDYAREIEDANKELSELQAQAAIYALDTTKEGQAKYASIMKEISERQRDISDKQREHAFDSTNDALDRAQQDFSEHVQSKIDEIEESMNNNGEWLKKVYDYINSKQWKDLRTKLKAYNYKYGDGKDSTVNDLFKVTGVKGSLDNVKTALDNLDTSIENLQKEIESPSANYKSLAQVRKETKYSNTKGKTDAQNLSMSDDIYRYYPNAYYDTKDNLWYTNDSKKISISTSGIISDIKKIAKSKKKAADKKKEIQALMKTLKTYHGYGGAVYDYKNNHLYKDKNKKVKIFHAGLSAGFVGDGYTPKQNESYNLLKSDELVLNKKDQFKLMSQLQALETMQKVFKKFDVDTDKMNRIANSGGGINITVEAPVTINGNADADTVKKLDAFGDKIASKTLDKLQRTLGQRGFSGKTASYAQKR